jgi:hypothetical protein
VAEGRPEQLINAVDQNPKDQRGDGYSADGQQQSIAEKMANLLDIGLEAGIKQQQRQADDVQVLDSPWAKDGLLRVRKCLQTFFSK